MFGIPGPALQAALLLIGLGAFSYILWRRFVVLRRAAPDPRTDHPGERLRLLMKVGFGQSRQLRYVVAGTLHILIFAGFLILSIRSLTLIGEAFKPGLSHIGAFYLTFKDWTALVVLVCCIVAALRRLLAHPARYHDRYARKSHAHEAYLVLGLISLLMIADALFEGAQMGGWDWRYPLSSLASLVVSGSESVGLAGFWIHNAALLFFLCYLPVSKHFHVISALPNTYFGRVGPQGRLKPPSYAESDLDKIETLGVGKLEDFTWKHILDFYSCTDCGRCSDHCPAYATGTPLSPRMISINCRDLAYEKYPVFGRAPEKTPALLGETVSEGELWACTTCGACEEACPVLIEYVDKIVDMRRRLVEDGEVPSTLQKAMADLEKKGNPYGKMPRKRGDWAKDSGVRVLKKGEEADLLFFTDSCAAYDPRIQDTARAFANVLKAAGADVGTLGRDEVDSGHEARRMGEEGLFETLRDKNLDALAERPGKEIVTTDPHALNALCNDYGSDVDRPVLHHTQVIAKLLDEGRVPVKRNGDARTYVFHDPCYLGRHNGVYDDPRRVLDALGLKTAEMERSRNRSFCCGGGSLYLFHEGECERRMGEVRLDMAAEAGAQVVVTACPFCLINLEDAVKTSGREGKIEVLDIAEVVEQALDGKG